MFRRTLRRFIRRGGSLRSVNLSAEVAIELHSRNLPGSMHTYLKVV